MKFNFFWIIPSSKYLQRYELDKSDLFWHPPHLRPPLPPLSQRLPATSSKGTSRTKNNKKIFKKKIKIKNAFNIPPNSMDLQSSQRWFWFSLPPSPSFSSSNVQIDAVEHMQFDSRLHKQKKMKRTLCWNRSNPRQHPKIKEKLVSMDPSAMVLTK